MDKEGKKIWVLCSAARAVENEIARASKQPSPGHSVLGSVREFSNLLGGFGEMRREYHRANGYYIGVAPIKSMGSPYMFQRSLGDILGEMAPVSRSGE